MEIYLKKVSQQHVGPPQLAAPPPKTVSPAFPVLDLLLLLPQLLKPLHHLPQTAPTSRERALHAIHPRYMTTRLIIMRLTIISLCRSVPGALVDSLPKSLQTSLLLPFLRLSILLVSALISGSGKFQEVIKCNKIDINAISFCSQIMEIKTVSTGPCWENHLHRLVIDLHGHRHGHLHQVCH